VEFTWTTVCRVPPVIGLGESEAVADLRAAGLRVGPHTLDNGCLAAAGVVIAQTYPADTLLPEATAARLTVSTGRDHHGHPCLIK
jgi:beta-lactam-binding protein with PASTA domain